MEFNSLKCLIEQSTTGACLKAHYFEIFIHRKVKKKRSGLIQTLSKVNRPV